jgi:hypothetical protein
MLRLGLRSGEVTPSRPLSALSQQSVNSVNSGMSLRTRPVAACRRPRPISIAVTGVTHESDSHAVHASHRHSEALCLFCPLSDSRHWNDTDIYTFSNILLYMYLYYKQKCYKTIVKLIRFA